MALEPWGRPRRLSASPSLTGRGRGCISRCDLWPGRCRRVLLFVVVSWIRKTSGTMSGAHTAGAAGQGLKARGQLKRWWAKPVHADNANAAGEHLCHCEAVGVVKRETRAVWAWQCARDLLKGALLCAPRSAWLSTHPSSMRFRYDDASAALRVLKAVMRGWVVEVAGGGLFG